MEQKCKKCGKELNQFELFECESCINKDYIKMAIIVVLLVIGIRFAWAKFVYNDFRCFLAECRIAK